MSQPRSIFLVTHSKLPNLSADDVLLMEAISERGGSATPVVWNDPNVPWHRAGISVVRSTWDYFLAPDDFKAWIGEARHRTRLANDADLLLWNIHKQYLLELQSLGIPIVPTVQLGKDSEVTVLQVASAQDWKDIVIKPAVSASAYLTKSFERVLQNTRDVQRHLDLVHERGDALIQPLIEEVFTLGERSMIYFDGEFSHAVKKTPFNSGPTAGPGKSAVHASTPAERVFGNRVLATLPMMPLYARVDFVPANGQLLLMELELIEPALHLSLCPGAASKLASILLAKANGTDSNSV